MADNRITDKAMINKTIHYIWLGNSESFSLLNQYCVNSWQKNLPDFSRVFWNEAAIRETFADHDLLTFNKLIRRKKYAFAADYARCLILEKYGGIYLDCDVEIIRDLTPLLNCQAFLGLEDVNRPNCAVLAAQPAMPFISELKHAIIQDGGITEIPALAWQVLSAGNDMIMDYNEPTLINSVTIYPERYFYPYNPYRENSVKQLVYGDISQDCYSIHHWQKSWHLSFSEWLCRFIKRRLNR